MVLDANGIASAKVRQAGWDSIRAFLAANRQCLKGKVLDFGCGKKHRYKDLVRGQWVGFDPGYGAGLVPPPTDTYDVVLVTQVLQFVDDPRATLAMLDGFLRPGGLWVISYSASWYECQPQDTWRVTGCGMARVIPAAKVLLNEPILTLRFTDFRMNLLYGMLAEKAADPN